MCCLLYRSFDLRMHIGELVSSGSTSAAVCSIMLSSFTPVEATARLSFGDTHWIPRLRDRVGSARLALASLVRGVVDHLWTTDGALGCRFARWPAAYLPDWKGVRGFGADAMRLECSFEQRHFV